MNVKTPSPPRSIPGWRVNGPGGVWSIWDHGDELVVCQGPTPKARVVARVREEICRRVSGDTRRYWMEKAASAIHTAVLLGQLYEDEAEPNFETPWERWRG
jgi:hypothetical protein